MEKSVRKILTVFAFTMAASALIGGIGLCKANLSAEATSSESSDFKVKGASVRVVDGEYQPAVRFHVEMSETEYESYGIAESGVTTGTLILPESKLQGGTLDLNNTDALDIVTKNEENNFWRLNSEGKMESVAYVSKIPDTDYSTELSVVGYVKTENGETFYTQQVNDISLAWVAYAEYNDEKSDLTTEQRESLMNTYATFDVSFNGGETQSVRYGQKLTAPEVGVEDGKTLIGWYNRNYTNKWSFSDNVVKGNVNLFAKYSVTPVISHGVLTWSGSADEYNIYNGDGETPLGTVSGNSYDLAKALEYKPGNYDIRIKPVDNKSIEYESVKFNIVGLTQGNFKDELTNSSADKYFVLTEDISVKYKSSDYAWGSGYTPVDIDDHFKISYIPSFEGVLDGRGFGIDIQYKGTSVFVGGLFGTMQNAVIRNLVYTAELNTYGDAIVSGGLVREMGANSIVENCYISVRLNASQAGIQDNFGAITRVASSATSIVRNCVVDAAMYDPTKSNVRVWLPHAINGTAGNNMNVYNNAFILNDALPTIDTDPQSDSYNKDVNGRSYAELYAVCDLTSANNYVYATLDDFVNGKNCNRWTYENSVSRWDNNVSDGTVYKVWENTSFAYDETKGFTLCGKPIPTTE